MTGNNLIHDSHDATAVTAVRSRRPLLLAAAVTGLLLAFAAPLFTSQAQEVPGTAEWQALGETTYTANCAACHQATGAGIPGAFPPLAGHAAELASLPGGANYLMHTVLFGLTGEITVDGMAYNGMMPAWQHLGDAEIAAVLDYVVTAWPEAGEAGETFEPVTADDVAAARAMPLTAEEVHDLRNEVVSQ